MNISDRILNINSFVLKDILGGALVGAAGTHLMDLALVEALVIMEVIIIMKRISLTMNTTLIMKQSTMTMI